ncbi:MAG: hypothetical protein MK291_11700, partial [Planctomycetes bacterium]|nr:hypothetical protein [Planctomycetota bacterium]
VKFLSRDRLVVAHRAAAMVYLIDISQELPRVVHSLRLGYYERLSWKYFHPDLMALDGDTLYLSAYRDRYAVVRIREDRLTLEGVQAVEGDKYHGCAVQDDAILLGGVRTGQIKRVSKVDGSVAPLDVEMSEPRRIKMISAQGELYFLSLDRQVGAPEKPGCSGDAWFSRYRVEGGRLVEVDSVSFAGCLIEGAVSSHGLHFVSMHDAVEERGYVVTLRAKDTLEIVKKTPCEDFPHGLDIHEEALAYSSYSTSSVHIRPLSEFLPEGPVSAG